MKQLRHLLFGLVAIMMGIEAILFFLPAPSGVAASDFRLQLAVLSSFSLNYFAAALLFVLGLRGFKPAMAKAYRITTWSMVFFGIANLQYPILLYFGVIPDPWSTHGGSIAVVIPGVLLHYIGARTFLAALGVTSPFGSWIWLGAALVGASLLATALPHYKELPEAWYVLHQASTAINMVLNFFTAAIFLRLMTIIGPSYQRAVRWTVAAVSLSTLGFLQVVLVTMFFGQNNSYSELGFTALPFVVVAAMYVGAGYYFCKIHFYGLQAQGTTSGGTAMLDVVTTLAQLVSNPSKVDMLLDKVRLITANMKPGMALGEHEQLALAEVYLALEAYLLTNEPLRTFTRAGLRARLSEEALAMVARKETQQQVLQAAIMGQERGTLEDQGGMQQNR